MIRFLLLIWAMIILAPPFASAQADGETPAGALKARLEDCHTALVQDTASLSAIVRNYLDAAGESGACDVGSQASADIPKQNFSALRALVKALDETLLEASLQNCSSDSALCGEVSFTLLLQSRLAEALEPSTAALYLVPPEDGNLFGERRAAESPQPPNVFGDEDRKRLQSDAAWDLLRASAQGYCDAQVAETLNRLWEESGSFGPQNADIDAALSGVAADASCVEGIKRAAEIQLMRAFLNHIHAVTYAKDAFRRLADRSEIQFARWEAYNFGGGTERVQLPWELWVNGLIYERGKSDGFDLWPDPPSSALTLLHPVAGIAPYDVKGVESGVIGAVEILGYSRWSYSDAHKRKNEWGASIAAVYADRASGKDWHPGAVVRTPWRGINIVYARLQDTGPGEESDLVALSVDVSTLFSKGGFTRELACDFNLPVCE